MTEKGSKSKDNDPEDPLLTSERIIQRRKYCYGQLSLCKGIIILVINVAVILILIFILFPVVLMKSTKLQRSLVFMTSDSQLGEFINVNEYSNGTRNFYVVVNEVENITLGVAHYLPRDLISSSIQDKNFDYERSLAQQDYPILLHFHGNGENRFDNSDGYWKLREFFHVISFDYRSYGDSSKAVLSEEGVIQDSLALYKWLRAQTGQDNIYIWGKSLGAAFATHTLAKLYDENIKSMGLILEAPFTTLRDEIKTISYVKIFSWLPWFEITILDGFEKNGFNFKTADHILKVDCPIMILHAEDDTVIPYTLGEKLSEIAQAKRNPETQGNVTFHLFPAQYKYNHWGITGAPELVDYVRYHIDVCEKYNATKQRED